jgi:hypothetical protein
VVQARTATGVLVTVPLPLAFGARSASVGHDPFGCEKPGQLPRLLMSRKGQSTKSGDLRVWTLHTIWGFYADEAQIIPSPGIVIIGRMT